ncbi:MAG: glycosyl hydrolase family 8 [Lachnospiraceae bacterium]|nr:glycosyl hydrolase family 8 [Lachnospiraceae bacterium]
MNNLQKKNYRNVFREIGIDESDIQRKLQKTWDTFFYGGEDERVYYPVGEDMAYICDTGNDDARTEGMSYGMMICVQLDKKEEFDRLWKWAKTFMWMGDGCAPQDCPQSTAWQENEGYFAWSCATDGTKNAYGPAPDGEEYFAMALFFASHRWGDGEGIYEYSREARDILRACLHKGQNGRTGKPMWNHENHQILFVPGSDFTDPSYHLPHFYELFALWADEEDRAFWKAAAQASREYLAAACHPVTGFSPEYAEFDGRPLCRELPWTKERHDWFFSDSYRTVANIGLDYEWFGKDAGQREAADRIQQYLIGDGRNGSYHIYEIDGRIAAERPLHPVAIPATVAQASLAAENDTTREWVERFWKMELRTGKRRYYDNCLYFFAVLALSGNYRIW